MCFDIPVYVGTRDGVRCLTVFHLSFWDRVSHWTPIQQDYLAIKPQRSSCLQSPALKLQVSAAASRFLCSSAHQNQNPVLVHTLPTEPPHQAPCGSIASLCLADAALVTSSESTDVISWSETCWEYTQCTTSHTSKPHFDKEEGSVLTRTNRKSTVWPWRGVLKFSGPLLSRLENEQARWLKVPSQLSSLFSLPPPLPSLILFFLLR